MKCQVLANDQTWRIPLIIPACDHRTHLRAHWDFVCYSLSQNSNCLICGNNRITLNFSTAWLTAQSCSGVSHRYDSHWTSKTDNKTKRNSFHLLQWFGYFLLCVANKYWSSAEDPSRSISEAHFMLYSILVWEKVKVTLVKLFCSKLQFLVRIVRRLLQLLQPNDKHTVWMNHL